MKFKYLLLIIFAVSCAPKIKNFDSYQKQFLSKSQFLPTADQINGKIPKIAVFELEENSNEVASQASLGKSLANNVENLLAKNKLASLVDRKAAKKLEQEVKLSEMNKTGSYKGPQIADYALSGAISNAGFTKKYKNGSAYIDPQTKALVTTPPGFLYKSEVSGNLKIYEIPSMTVVENIEFSGKAQRKEDAQQDGGFSLGALQIGGKKAKGSSRDDNLIRKAGEDAIYAIEVDLKNALAQRGYILEKRSLEKKSIFKISLGSSHGIKHGDRFEIIGQFEGQNGITGDSEVERKIIATGRISDIINPKTSWIVLDDKKKTSKVRLGDAVKMKYKRSAISSFMRKAGNL